MKRILTVTVAVLAALAATLLVMVWFSSPETKTCQDWAAADGLTGESVVIACQTGENAEGSMTEAEYRDRLNESLTFVKGIIDETGGL